MTAISNGMGKPTCTINNIKKVLLMEKFLGIFTIYIVLFFAPIIATLLFSITSAVILYFIFKSLLAPIPCKIEVEKNKKYFNKHPLLIGHCLLTLFLSVLIYLVFPVFYFFASIMFVDKKIGASYWYILLVFPLIIWRLMILFETVTSSTCRKYPGIVCLLNEKRKTTRRRINKIIIVTTILLFILFLVSLPFIIKISNPTFFNYNSN